MGDVHALQPGTAAPVLAAAIDELSDEELRRHIAIASGLLERRCGIAAAVAVLKNISEDLSGIQGRA